MNLLSRILVIFVRVLIFLPAFFSTGYFLSNLSGRLGLAWQQPSFFWHFFGIQGICGILCLIPYPNFLFTKKIKIFFLLLIVVCTVLQLWRTWLPSYYSSSQLNDYPQYVKDFEEAKHHSKNDGFYTSQEENGITLWQVQYPDFYEWEGIVFMTIFSFGPLTLFFIRDYQVRCGFTWKEAINKITSR
jgi:hypothetical protein